ncbi:hypothetical protein F8O01_12610 [Pseudoclavibacter chungangensis]|uniref:Uncharacterized protein n=1 Tax=Pseudoclavibacter chungangensis TaxID=587635 RepID=A0A7J5BPM9_9MICO|nr:hypothetical protein [Pseudoclavibacter chungangensis]KAB1655093.1 hypothetical protein F8O01_12610 [Pseudoclavibacter chungangensis]NYJ66137.1 hypothetical protein [Pseudoclavibacter chungangensis]
MNTPTELGPVEQPPRPRASGTLRGWVGPVLRPRWVEALAWGFGVGVALGVPAIVPILVGGLTVMFAVDALWAPPGGEGWIDNWGLVIPIGAAVGGAVLLGAVIALRALVVLRRLHWSTLTFGCYVGSILPAIVLLAIVPPW